MKTKLLATGIISALLSAGVQAEWALDLGESSLYYVTSKASAVSEVNSFGTLSGGIAADGAATLVIDLASVNTAVEIRDQRMRDIVFQVAEHPTASVSLNVDAAALEAMPVGSLAVGTYTAQLSLHGMSQDIPADLRIVKLEDGDVQVQLARPLIIAAASFGLAAGVEELRNLAGLPSINPNVVVDFSLVYRKQ